ncbi:MAG: peptidase domain-containing ABC transporter, partial [Deltaproteobacteria bacterium]|nr:peptidase domain-containing ABC transporter [Deltaproteobacteria bacterium]
LDTRNESIIMNNLEQFFTGKTVVVVAHRLSTVRYADQIIVIEKGVIVETGEHSGLISKKGAYYNLVRDQLELES